jgi:MSHA biogenesis protein MshK
MVEHVIGGTGARRLRFAIAAGLLAICAAQGAAADTMRDPTVPSGSSWTTPHGTASSTGPVLQSVMISPGLRVVVISGQAVKLGEKYGDSQVVRITESEVVLQGRGGSQTLKLYPGVEKRVVSRSEQKAKYDGMKGNQ